MGYVGQIVGSVNNLTPCSYNQHASSETCAAYGRGMARLSWHG